MEQYPVSFGEAIQSAFANYCKFTGRASCSEYWWFALFVFLVGLGLVIFSSLMEALIETGMGGIAPVRVFVIFLWIVFPLAIILPSWGLTFRRLHDTGRSGWWCLLTVIPSLLYVYTAGTFSSLFILIINLIGSIVLLVFLSMPSEPGENKYGPVPNTYNDIPTD